MKLKTIPWNDSFLWIFAHHYVHMLDSKHRCKDTKDKFNPFALSALQSRTGSEKATGKNLFSLQGTLVLIARTLYSLPHPKKKLFDQ